MVKKKKFNINFLKNIKKGDFFIKCFLKEKRGVVILSKDIYKKGRYLKTSNILLVSWKKLDKEIVKNISFKQLYSFVASPMDLVRGRKKNE